MANGGNNLAVPLSFAHPRKAIIFFFTLPDGSYTIAFISV